VFGGGSEGGQPRRFPQVQSSRPMPFPAEQGGDGLMARATETDEILKGLVAKVRIGVMMHFGRHMLMPHLTAITVALEDQATFFSPYVTVQIAEIGHLHAPSLSRQPWPNPTLPCLDHVPRHRA
jgi:hypothetical protein